MDQLLSPPPPLASRPVLQPTVETFEAGLGRNVRLQYLLYRPEPQARVPLVLFLHGAGERGGDLGLVQSQGLPKLLSESNPFAEPVLVLAPQCPVNSWWLLELEALEALLDDALARYPVDPGRVYLTGLSMGGYGSWFLAEKSPQRFAAVVPICGGGITHLAGNLTELPLWAFHGEDDPVVPVSESIAMVAAVNQAGGNARLTTYPGVGHNAWDPAYRTPELYSWLLARRNPSPGT